MKNFLIGNGFILTPRVTTAERNALTAANGMIVYDTTANAFYKYENGAWGTFAGGSAAWGAITGTLSNQTDLQTALSNKANASDLTAHTSNTSNPHSVTATQVDALKRDGSNANSDIDLGAYKLNAQSLGVKGVNGAGHVGLKHQASNATASANETSLFAGSDGELYYKNDGNSVVQIATRAWVTAQGYITNVITALGYTPENVSNKDTDGTLAANSDTKYASQKATKTYVDTTVAAKSSSVYGGIYGTVGAGLTRYTQIHSIVGTIQATESIRQTPMARSGSFTAMYLNTSVSQPASGSLVITLRKNSAATSITITIAAGSAAGTFSVTATSSFVAGDLYAHELVNNASGASTTILGITLKEI